VRFKAGFPFWFERQLDEALMYPICHDRHPEWSLFHFARLGYPDPSNWSGLGAFPSFRVDLLGQNKSLFRWDGFYPIYSGSVLALVSLRHSAHREKAGCSGFHQHLLKCVGGLGIAMVTGSKDALLESVHVLLKLAPGQRAPTLTRRSRLVPVSGCLRL
jgi:hypothetical protein